VLNFIGKLFQGNSQKVSRSLSVLLIEDNDTDKKMVSAIIKKQGWSVEIADNGKQGVDLAVSKKPDVIVMDCEMPGMSGVDACKEIKDRMETKDIPVIFLTGNDSPGNIVDCFEAEAENYLTKPVSAKGLIDCISKVCDQ
jgi:CheY-like chemotaxis protein